MPSMESLALFFVATTLTRKLDWVLHKMGPATRPTTPPVDWGSRSYHSFPSIQTHLSFAKHYALGAVSRKEWENEGLTNLERLKRARFWEHSGPNTSQKLSQSWGEDGKIMLIEAVEFLGWADSSKEDTIDNCMFLKLRVVCATLTNSNIVCSLRQAP
jgi:hypothetical protein